MYFFNTQRLSRTSLLTRGADTFAANDALIAPDDLAYNIWQTLENTIEDDGLTVYLVLDEAHRGFNTRTSSDKSTIVRSLVNGEKTGLPIPVVWGISATVDRFTEAMKDAEVHRDRVALPSVTVDPTRVQRSGLIKDAIRLDIAAEHGNLETNLTARAARKLKESAKRWSTYLAGQAVLPGEKVKEAVQPLLVLQVPELGRPPTASACRSNIVAAELGGSHLVRGSARAWRSHDENVRFVGGRLDRTAARSGDDAHAGAESEGRHFDRWGTARVLRCCSASGQAKTTRTLPSC